ncbi:MAG: hypothetical protein ACRCYY_10350, partial [Trueperaceae bacterium]
ACASLRFSPVGTASLAFLDFLPTQSGLPFGSSLSLHLMRHYRKDLVLQLDPADAKKMQLELNDVYNRYADKKGAQSYIMRISLAPRKDG